MSILKTKPRYCEEAVPTDRGWVNPATNELLVSVRNLKSRLTAEKKALNKAKKMENNETPPVRIRKEYAPRKPKVIGEVTESKLPAGMKLLGEVVEYDLDKSIIAE